MSKLIEWLVPRDRRFAHGLVARYAALLLGACLLSLCAEVLLRLELWTPGIRFLQPEQALHLFALRSILWPVAAIFAATLLGGYGLMTRADRAPQFSLAPYIGWVLMLLGMVALFVSSSIRPQPLYSPGLAFAHGALLLIHLGALCATVELALRCALAEKADVLERLWIGLGCSIPVLWFGAVAWHFQQADMGPPGPWLFETLSTSSHLLYMLVAFGAFGAALALRQATQWPARLLAVAALYLAATGIRVLGLLARSDTDIFLHDTYATLAATYACTGAALLGMLSVNWTRRSLSGALLWAAAVVAALIGISSLRVLPMMIELGKAGMPLSYIDYSSEFADMQSSLSLWTLIWIAGVALILTLTIVFASRPSEALDARTGRCLQRPEP